MSPGRIRSFPFEAFIWAAALMALAIHDPFADPHFSLCPLYNAGWEFCPGCGLGRSISLLFHGYVIESLFAHPFGIFAVIILTLRIFDLTKKNLKRYGAHH